MCQETPAGRSYLTYEVQVKLDKVNRVVQHVAAWHKHLPLKAG